MPSIDVCGSCGAAMHRLCAAENVWLKFCGAAGALMCFDCSLVGALLQGTVHQGQLEAYYRQVVDWSRIEVSPFALGAALTFNALTLHQVCKSTQRARLAPTAGKCKVCKQGSKEGSLLACSFCTAVFHNSSKCLGDAKVFVGAAGQVANPPVGLPGVLSERKASLPSSATSSSRLGSRQPAARPSASAAGANKLCLC